MNTKCEEEEPRVLWENHLQMFGELFISVIFICAGMFFVLFWFSFFLFFLLECVDLPQHFGFF